SLYMYTSLPGERAMLAHVLHQRGILMPRRPYVLATLVVVALLAVTRAAPVALAQPSTQPPLQWAPCDDIPGEMQCAVIQVPVDYARPDGPQFGLRLGRLPTTDPARKRGSLLMI